MFLQTFTNFTTINILKEQFKKKGYSDFALFASEQRLL
jgi:hypothetical protein